MSVYVIVEVEVTDEKAYVDYRAGTAATIVQYGGEFVVRAGKVEPVEGDWNPKRIVVLKFKDFEAAHRWHDSPEYAPLLAIRKKAAKSKMIMVEGVS